MTVTPARSRQARGAAPVGVHDVDLLVPLPVAVGIERDAPSVWRPGGMARKHRGARAVTHSQPPFTGAVGTNRVEVKRAVAARVEDDRLPVGRPGGMRIVAVAGACEAALAGAVGVDDVERGVAVARALEDELTPVRRPRRIDVEEDRWLLRLLNRRDDARDEQE